MKKAIIFLLLVLTLCACSEKETLKEDIPNVPAVSDNKEQPKKEPEEEYFSEEMRIEEAKAAAIDGMFYSVRQNLFERRGISIAAENVVHNDDGSFSFDLALTNKTGTIRIPATGILYTNETALAEKDYDFAFNAVWGTAMFIDTDTLAVCTEGKLYLVNTASFDDVEVELALPENEETWLFTTGAAWDGNKYIVSVYELPKDGSEPEARPVKIYSFDRFFGLYDGYSSFYADESQWFGFFVPEFFDEAEIINFEEKNYFCCGNYYYSLSDNMTFAGYNREDFHGEKYDLEMLDIYKYSDDFEGTERIAVLKSEGEILSYITVGERMYQGWNEDGTPATSTEEGDMTFSVTDSFYHRTVVYDFNAKTAVLTYNYTENDISEAFAVSPNGKYSLHEASFTSGGDGYGFEVAIKNRETGEINHIFRGGMGINCGFFKNGEVYMQGGRELKIYSPETREEVFDINDNFPLVYNSETGYYRDIFTFRRNPDDKTFVILFWEGDAAPFYSSEDSADYPCYKIGYLDAEGRLIKEFESEVPVALGMYCWPQDAVFYYSDGKYTVTTQGSKGTYGINFTFDTETETFSEAKENEY
ncbi:MAG: hypothetical protein IJ306_06555 [Oscillospiraceae bacterium]|nr:hypothetical protein [Oscillospiraceae bacterium]